MESVGRFMTENYNHETNHPLTPRGNMTSMQRICPNAPRKSQVLISHNQEEQEQEDFFDFND